MRAESFSMPLPLLRHVAPLNDRNCLLTVPVVKVKGRRDRDPLLEITKIWVLKCGKSSSTNVKPVYNESGKFIESHAVHFDINWPSNLIKMVTVLGLEFMVSCASIRYAPEFLTPGIRSLIQQWIYIYIYIYVCVCVCGVGAYMYVHMHMHVHVHMHMYIMMCVYMYR